MSAAGAATNSRLDALNPQQREAVVHTDGPMLVVAGAGSGKTRVLTHRVAHLIESGAAAPSEILAITFTNRAANEMKERVQQLVGGRTAARMWVMTFHAACGRLLRRDAERLGYRSSFTIYDQADQVRLVKACIEELELDPKRFAPRAVHSAISRAKDRLLTAEGYADQVGNFFEQTVASVYALYQRRLYAANSMDFDDMILQAVLLLEADEEARAAWQERFSHIMVDEYQDTNHAQFRLLSVLAAKHRNIAVVGDPDQSIYAFRGADIRNIAEFEHDFPGARVVALEQNYRSTQAILDAANAVIARNPDRRPKKLWSDLGRGLPVRVVEADDEHAEARFVAGEITRALEEGAGPADVAVFYRMNAQSRVLEDVLVRQGVGVPGRRRAAVLRAGRDQGRDRLSPGDPQPGRRGLAAPDREPAPARHRDGVARPPRGARLADELDAARGDRPRQRRPAGHGGGGAGARVRRPDRGSPRGGVHGVAGGPARAGAGAVRLPSDARGRAHVRVAGADSRTWTSSSASPASSQTAGRRTRRSRRSCRRSRSTPTRTRSTSRGPR